MAQISAGELLVLKGFRAVSELLGSGQMLGTRLQQEDHFRVSVLPENPRYPPTVLLALSDGMGGQAGGAIAANLVVQACEATLANCDDPRTTLEASLHAANEALASAGRANAALADMGATLLAVLVTGDEFVWLSVGDSILWRWDGAELKRLNADHSMRTQLQALVDLGRISQEQYDADPRKSMLLSALTGRPISMIDRSVAPQRLEQGHILLLATDGIQTLDPATIERHMRETDDASSLVTTLLGCVERAARTSQDNTTLLAYQHSAVDSVASRFHQCEAVTVRRQRPKRQSGGALP